jgi:hypothetical protein
MNRFVWITILDLNNTVRTLTVRFDTSKTTDTLLNITTCKVTKVIFKGKAAGDSFGLKAESYGSGVSISDITQFLYPYAGLAQDTILPRQRGKVGKTGDIIAQLPALVHAGFTVYPGLTTRTCRGTSARPDSGWEFGHVIQYQKAAGLATIRAMPWYLRTDSAVRRNKTVPDVGWARSQQGNTIVFTSNALAKRDTIKNLTASGGNIFCGPIGVASDTMMVTAVEYITGDSMSATGGTNTAVYAFSVGTDSNATGNATLNLLEINLVAAGMVAVTIRGANQISTYAEGGTDLYGANKCTPKIYTGATPVYFNWGGTGNAEGRLTFKIRAIKVYAQWAGIAPLAK